MYRSYFTGILISRVSHFFGRRTDAQVKNSKSGKYQYRSFKQDIWRYKHLIAKQPPVENVTSFEDYIKNGIPITPYIDQEILSDRFPIISKKK
jgi:hypothetical protein